MVGTDVFSLSRAWVSHFASVANGLAEKGWSVLVYAPAYRHPTDQQLVRHLNPLVEEVTGSPYRAQRDPTLHGRNYVSALLRGSLSIERILKASLVDCIYFRSSPLTLGWALLLSGLTRRLGIVTMFEHNGWLHDDVQQNLSGLKKALMPQIIQHLQISAARHSSINRVVSSGIGDVLSLHGVPPNTLVTIGNGTDCQRFVPMSKTECCMRLGLDPTVPYVGYIGGVSYWQGLEHVVKAASCLRTMGYTEVKFLVGGEGSSLPECQRLADKQGVLDCFHFSGMVPFDVAPMYIGCFDVAVYTPTIARNERIGISPLKIRDYAACGKPIVTVAIKGLEEVGEAGFGLLARPEDSQDIATKLAVLIEDEGRRLEMGQQARSYAESHYDWRFVVSSIDSVLRDAANRDRQDLDSCSYS